MLQQPWHDLTSSFANKVSSGPLPVNEHRLACLSFDWHQTWNQHSSIAQSDQIALVLSSHWSEIERSQAAEFFGWRWHAIRVFQCPLVTPLAFAHKESKTASRIDSTIQVLAPCLANRAPLNAQALCPPL